MIIHENDVPQELHWHQNVIEVDLVVMMDQLHELLLAMVPVNKKPSKIDL